MKLPLFIVGLILVAIGVIIVRPIAKQLPDFGFLDFLIGGFGLSLLTSGLKLLWAALVLPR